MYSEIWSLLVCIDGWHKHMLVMTSSGHYNKSWIILNEDCFKEKQFTENQTKALFNLLISKLKPELIQFGF